MKNHSMPLIAGAPCAHPAAQAQSCPSGNTSINTYTNTCYPGAQATVAAGATSITVGASGSCPPACTSCNSTMEKKPPR